VADYLIISCNKPGIRDQFDLEDLRYFFAFININFDRDIISIQSSDHAGIPESFLFHDFTGAAPIGVKVHKHLFIFGFAAGHTVRIRLPSNILRMGVSGYKCAAQSQQDQGGEKKYRSYLKKVFWPKLFVGRSAQILEILEYSSGLILTAASILNQNPFFEMTSNKFHRRVLPSGANGGIYQASILAPI
jgi:hypothetical protein